MEEEKQETPREIPTITKRKTWPLFVMLGSALLIVPLVFIFSGSSQTKVVAKKDTVPKNTTIKNTLGAPPVPKRTEKKPPPPKPPEERRGLFGAVLPPPHPNRPPANLREITGPGGKVRLSPPLRKRFSKILIFGKQDTATQKTNASSPPQEPDRTLEALKLMQQGKRQEKPSLKTALKPTKLHGARASMIPDLNFFLTKGTFLNCVLETAISSDVAGMTSCRLLSDVYSTNGKVVLLDRGSRIVGEYKAGMKQGQSRLFILWTRVETPTGVIVDLDSPATDSLGRSGVSGDIDTHFWQRFGAAFLFSLIDDGTKYLLGKAKGQPIQLNSTSKSGKDAASIILQNSINIPPTLRRNQGGVISVFVARDIDFRDVYGLR